jgi:hypothetical protein
VTRKTNSDLIRDLIESVATLKERIDNVRGDVERVESALDKFAEQPAGDAQPRRS